MQTDCAISVWYISDNAKPVVLKIYQSITRKELNDI